MVIAKGIPKSMGRVGSWLHGFPCFPYWSFPWPAFRAAMLDNPICAGQSMRRTRHVQGPGERIAAFPVVDIRKQAQGKRRLVRCCAA